MEEIIYTYILIKTDGTYLGWSKAKTEKPAGDGMQWIDWKTEALDDEGNIIKDSENNPIMVGKPLPEDIDSVQYKYENGELTRSNP